MTVPGVMVRTTARLTMPLASFGSSTWSQMLTVRPALITRAHVALHGAHGNTAHGNTQVLVPTVARGEGEAQQFRGFQGVVVEEFVEIAHAEKEQRVTTLGLRLDVLPKHGGEFSAWRCR